MDNFTKSNKVTYKPIQTIIASQCETLKHEMIPYDLILRRSLQIVLFLSSRCKASFAFKNNWGCSFILSLMAKAHLFSESRNSCKRYLGLLDGQSQDSQYRRQKGKDWRIWSIGANVWLSALIRDIANFLGLVFYSPILTRPLGLERFL